MIVSNSQAAQDIFALYINKFKRKGFFLDIGCGKPFSNNNTALLESIGWSGVLIDYDEKLINICKEKRKSKTVLADLSKENLNTILNKNKVPKIIDYVSVDLDSYLTLDCIKKINFKRRKIRCMTFEHDYYLNKDSMRDESRNFLESVGLKIICKDVKISRYSNFEDWYVDPYLVDENIYNEIIYDNVHYSKIFTKIKLLKNNFQN